MNQGPNLNLIMLVAVAASTILMGMTLYAFFIESREGLRISLRRLLLTLGGGAALIIVCLNFDWGKSPETSAESKIDRPPTTQPATPPTEPDKKKIASLKSQREKLQKQVADINKEIKTLDGQISNLQHGKDPDGKKTPLNPVMLSRSSGWVFLAIGIVLFQILALFLVDDMRFLLAGWRKKGENQKDMKPRIEALDRMARAAQRQAYAEACDEAGKIEASRLDTLDQIDYYYLKAFCLIQLLLKQYTTDTSFPTPADKERMAETEQSLQTLLEIAPRLAEAEYLSGILHLLKTDYVTALQKFEKASLTISKKEADFDNFISTCCLHQASMLTIAGKQDDVQKLFDRVISIGVASDRVPAVILKSRLSQIHQQLNNHDHAAVSENMAAIHKVAGLSTEKKEVLDQISGSVNLIMLTGEGKYDEALTQTRDYMSKWLPAGLPEPDDYAAEELLFSVVDEETLPFPSEIFSGLYFLEACLQLRVHKNDPLTRELVDGVSRSLLRALQFVPRHREILAALGIVSFYGNPEKRAKAVNWVEAAIAMGALHPLLIHITETDKKMEEKRSGLLDKFNTLALDRLLARDISENMRKALLDELGQFKDFHPVLKDIQGFEKPAYVPLTVQAILNRARYLREFAKEVVGNEINPITPRLRQAQVHYETLTHSFQQKMQELNDVEQEIMQEIGKHVLR
jgi:tetratricopeptide (TPR) repeat protein